MHELDLQGSDPDLTMKSRALCTCCALLDSALGPQNMAVWFLPVTLFFFDVLPPHLNDSVHMLVRKPVENLLPFAPCSNELGLAQNFQLM